MSCIYIYIRIHAHDHLSEGCWQHLDVADFGNIRTQGNWNNMYVQRSLRLPECRKSTAMLARCVSQVVNMGQSSMHTCPGLPPCAPGQNQKQHALPQDQAVSDTRPRAGGFELFQKFGWWWGAGSQHQAPVQHADGYVWLGAGAPSPTTCLACMPL